MIRIALPLLLATLAVFVLSLQQGDQSIPLDSIARALLHPSSVDPATLMIVQDVRLPRAVLAVLVGIALAIAGALAQTVMRNPLAEPGLLGINSGAALAALVLIVHFGQTSPPLVSLAAFGGALAMACAIYLLCWRGGASSIRIILIGVGLSSLAGAAASFLSAFGDVTAVQRAQVWLAGSLYNTNWNEVRLLVIWLLPTIGLTLLAARELDLASFDDVSARGLGQRVQLVRGLVILICTLISGGAVAAAGLIGFVGLMAPHAARRLVGHRHARVLPIAALIGGFLVLSADLVGRTVIEPAQLPAGLMTAMLGAPFFAFLLWERRHARA